MRADALRCVRPRRSSRASVRRKRPEGGAETQGVKLVLDPEVIVARMQGRQGWVREARRQLEEHRRLQAQPIRAREPSGY